MSCAVTALPILVLLMEKLEIMRKPLGDRILRYASVDDVAIWGVLALILMDWQRVGKQAYIMLESYRNEQELFNLQCWALTAESFFDTAEWIWLYNHFGYTGDYEFIYFE